jgi:hypothetical protein
MLGLVSLESLFTPSAVAQCKATFEWQYVATNWLRIPDASDFDVAPQHADGNRGTGA